MRLPWDRNGRAGDEMPAPPLETLKQCDGKKAYSSFKHARYDARAIRAKADGDHAEAYRCRDCQAWHVGGLLTSRVRRPPRRPPAIEWYEDD